VGYVERRRITVMMARAGTSDMENFVVGIIGMGDMGKMYARRLSDAGWR
jgi:prephenate dehydrogenase (NADP+)